MYYDDEGEEYTPQFATLVDQMKYDFFMENFDKISLEQLESLVK